MKKENNQPVLSISLLCSGRNKQEMIKCLDSLMTIRSRLNSEIIIVDTGCGDDTKSLLKGYADQIIEFTWCNDFAKARNAGLKMCTGEWFMFIDDDEWFDNTDELVSFFTSGEYKEYGRARYRVRNYDTMEGTTYEDFWAARLEKMVPGLSFNGKIHEYMEPQVGKIKLIDCYVHHYGYVYQSAKDLYAKAVRNIKPLEEMIQEEPGNLRWRSQIIQEYLSVRDYDNTIKLCRNSLKLLDRIDDPAVIRHRTDFYVGIIKAETATYQYQEAIADFNEFKKDRRNNSICKAALCYFIRDAYYNTKDYLNAKRYSQKYIEIYDKWHKYKDMEKRLEEESSLLTRDVFIDSYYQRMLTVLIASGIRSGDQNILHSYFKRIDFNSTESDRVIPLCETITEAFADSDFDDRYIAYAEKLLSYDSFMEPTCEYIKRIEFSDKTRFNRVVNVYGRTITGDKYYVLYMRLLYTYLNDEDDKLTEMFRKLFSSVIDIFNLNTRVWDIADEKHVDLKAIFVTIPFEKWEAGTVGYLSQHSIDEEQKVERFLKIMDGNSNVRFEYFRLKADEYTLINEHCAKDSILLRLQKYCSKAVSFYRTIYTPEWFTGDMTVLPPQCRFAVRFLEAIDIDNKINSSDRIKELEKCVDIYTPFNQVLGDYIKEYGEREKAKLLQIQKNPELEQIYQMLDLLKQAIELQEKTGSEELQVGIMQQRQLVESMLANILSEVSIGNDADNGAWLLSVENCLRKDGDIHDKR